MSQSTQNSDLHQYKTLVKSSFGKYAQSPNFSLDNEVQYWQNTLELKGSLNKNSSCFLKWAFKLEVFGSKIVMSLYLLSTYETIMSEDIGSFDGLTSNCFDEFAKESINTIEKYAY
jgi:hypothetical protein